MRVLTSTTQTQGAHATGGQTHVRMHALSNTPLIHESYHRREVEPHTALYGAHSLCERAAGHGLGDGRGSASLGGGGGRG